MIKELVRNNFDNFFPSIFNNGFKWLSGFDNEFSKILNGKCDFEEDNEKYLIELEVPGVEKDEININLKNDNLTIEWSRKKENKTKNGKGKYERSEGSFTRSFYVEGADNGKIEAELKNGVLKITVPKLEKSRSKNIVIK